MARACGVCQLLAKPFLQERSSFRSLGPCAQSMRMGGLHDDVEGDLAERKDRATGLRSGGRRSCEAAEKLLVVGGPRHRPTHCKRRAFQSRRSFSRKFCPGAPPRAGRERARASESETEKPFSFCSTASLSLSPLSPLVAFQLGSAAPPRAPCAARREKSGGRHSTGHWHLHSSEARAGERTSRQRAQSPKSR